MQEPRSRILYATSPMPAVPDRSSPVRPRFMTASIAEKAGFPNLESLGLYSISVIVLLSSVVNPQSLTVFRKV